MCGIAGIFGQPDRNSVAAMVRAMAHRGPDGHGLEADNAVALGHARLAIIDLTEAGRQPMLNRSGDIWIVFNGEIYNFQAERQALEQRGWTFRSHSDTEVALAMYEAYGDDFLQRLRGMFALALYDRRNGPGRERLLLARDHVGVKPLLYARRGGRLIFASELKAMLASGLIEREIDPLSLRMLMTWGSVCQPRTMVAGVAALLPGHRLIAENGAERIECFWRPGLDRVAGLRRASYGEIRERTAALLDEAVRLQMIADVTVGAFLSGGIDSSLLVALMARHSAERIKTFSVGFESHAQGIDETDDAAIVARHLGVDHTRVEVNGRHVRDRIAHIAAGLDQPSVDGVNSYFVTQAAAGTVKVSISGTGSDEIFAGYPWFAAMRTFAEEERQASLKTRLRGGLSHLARPLAGVVGGRLGHLAARLERRSFVATYAGQYQIFGAAGGTALLAPALRADLSAEADAAADIAVQDRIPDGTAIERATALCLGSYLQNQLLRDIDAVSMAHSLEVRVPFLDPALVDLALSLPDDAKLKPGGGGEPGSYQATGIKRVLLDIGAPYLPEGFSNRAKRGFGMPFDAWMRDDLRDVLDDTLSPASIAAQGWLEPAAVADVVQKFDKGTMPWSQPWLLMMTELWRREVLEARPTLPLESAPLS